jgi:predicted alpha/beta superfamily hydrolase
MSGAACEPSAAQPTAATTTAQPAASATASATATAAPTAGGPAQNAVVIGDRQTFRSSILAEERTILVHTPPGYQQGKARYPVLYLLDGDAHFHHTTGITTFLSATQRAPELIVVGITNTVRDRDLTPTPLAERPGSGGAAKFLAFLKDEVQPRIESGYRTVPYRILVGHSLGGLFATHALVNAPGVFNAHISISPSLWWDGQLMRREAEKVFAARADLQGFLYFTVGDEPGRQLDSNKAFEAMLKAKAPKGLEWQFKHMEREDHSSIPHRSTLDGLEALFAGWAPPKTIDTVKALEAHYEALAKKHPFAGKIPENVLNNFGYGLMEKHLDEAIAAFQLNVKLYPDSANVYDSLGEAQAKGGQLDLSKASYEMAVRKATESADPQLAVFKANLERASKAAATSKPAAK